MDGVPPPTPRRPGAAPDPRPAPPGGGASDEWLSLHDYGLIGNESTGALVSRHGSIDWACLPRFDSPSVFARLLDRRAGGAHRLAPQDRYVSHQQYVGGTNVLTTFFEIRRGVTLIVTDFMPMGPAVSAIGGDPRIVRRALARGAPIEVSIAADPRFDYGRSVPTWALREQLAIAQSGASRLACTSPWPWFADGPVARSTGTVVPGTPVFAQLRWGDAPAAEPTAAALLSVTDAYWRGWVSPPDAPLRRVAARWHPWVERSELVLKLLSYADAGVFVAAPTTSLPEWPGATRNWDYRYVWIRDAAFTAQVFLLLGHVSEARAYVAWAFDRAARLTDGEELRTVFTVDGGTPPAEEELRHLEGYRASRPVRVGNGAAGQRQLDIYGEILDSALLLEGLDPAFVRDHWPTIERLAEQITKLWTLPDSGLWEARSPPAQHVHSKLMCWVALDRAIQLGRAFGKTEPIDRWTRVADEIRAAILSRGYDERRGSFVQAFDQPQLDASALRIGLDGFLPPTEPRVVGTIAAVESTLARGPFVRRYEGDDGLAGPEGAFLLCSFWLVESLAKSGQTERALEHWRALLDVAGPLLLFSEEYDPASQLPLGNYPQAFTHIGLLRAAFALGLVSPEG
ncbi:MAG TPA: glycoside hydrolase family 15 protein [Thermoplasmata archaeon]|nr:glycoside hydrolase family 15 protein [Thermoplasmata archaeon]